MVYSGKPSTGCITCRERRIKCDETWPICKQCAKSHKNCTGPRNRWDVSIRFCAGKKKGSPPKGKKFGPENSPTSDTVAGKSRVNPYHKLFQDSRRLQLPLQERANAYFTLAYVPYPIDEDVAGFTGFPILPEISREPEHYRLAFEACAMAAFTKDAADPYYYNDLPIMKYDLALRAMRDALQDPNTMYQDATLASILLLALFECITPTDNEQKAWCEHIKAAVSLAKERIYGKDANQIEHSLFIAVRTHLVLYSLKTLECDGDDEVWWPQDNVTYEYTFTQKLCAEASLLGAKSKTFFNEPRNERDARELLDQCLAQDKKCRDWWESSFANIGHGTAWTDQTTGSDPSGVWLLMLWNMLIYARVLLNSVIMRCIAYTHEHSRLDYGTTSEYTKVFLVLQDLVYSNTTMNANQRKEKSVPGLRRYFMIWPLNYILFSRYLADGQRIMIQEQLQHVGEYLGVCASLSLPKEPTKAPPYWSTTDRQLSAASNTNSS